jgi:hypothetical protein
LLGISYQKERIGRRRAQWNQPDFEESLEGYVMAKNVIKNVGFNPIRKAHDLGFRSNHAYTLGCASIGLSLLSWLVSRMQKSHDKAQSDRWGIFIGHWAPTFFAVGLALKNEE